MVCRCIDSRAATHRRGPTWHPAVVREIGWLGQDDPPNIALAQYANDPAISVDYFSGLGFGWVDTDDESVVERVARKMGGQLVVQHAIGRDKPLSQRAVHKQHEDAGKTQRDQPVTLLLPVGVQRDQIPWHQAESIEKGKPP